MGNSTRSLKTFDSHCSEMNISRTSITPEYWESYSISDDYRDSSIVTAVVTLLFMIIGLPGNAVIIVSIIQQKLYRETTHILVLNLAISDFLLCLVTMPLTVVAGFAGEYIFGSSDYTRCQVCQIGILLTLLSALSVNILGLISLDRFIFVKFPLYYDRVVTKKRVIAIVIAVWLLSIIEAIPPLFGFGEIKYGYSMASCHINFFPRLEFGLYYGLVLIAISFIPAIVSVVTTIWVACIARKQVMKIYGTRTGVSKEQASEQQNQSVLKKNRKKMMRKQLILLRAFGSILVANILVWSPLVVFSVVFVTVDKFSIPLGLYSCTYICFVMHAVLHPMIEGCFIPEIKMTFLKLLGIHHCQKLRRQSELSKSTEKTATSN